MSIGSRIKTLRKHLNMNQTDFGAKIGLKQTAIGMYENDQRKIADRTILLLCQTYGVNEDWLRSGNGEMFLDNREKVFADIAQVTEMTETKKDFLTLFLDLPEDAQKSLRDYAKFLADQYNDSSEK